MPADKRIKIRRGTAAEWATAETSAAQLAAGEVAWVDNDLVKGDGTTKVASLPRAGTGTYVQNPIRRWLQKLHTDPANAKYVRVGDSTSDAAAGGATGAIVTYHRLRNYHTQPGGCLAGLTPANIISGGSNGQSLLDWFASPSGGYVYNRNALAASGADLIEYSWLLNDVRTGNMTVQQGIDRLIALLDWTRATLPSADVVLRMPNSITTTNTGGLNFVTDSGGAINPAGAAQTYTDILRKVYLTVGAMRPDVLVLDTQTDIFGTQAMASSSLMLNQLHPSGASFYVGGSSSVPCGGGYVAIADYVASKVGKPENPFGVSPKTHRASIPAIIEAGGTGAVDLRSQEPTASDILQYPVSQADSLYVQGVGSPFALSAVSILRPYGNDVHLGGGSLAGVDFSAYIGRQALVASPHAGPTTGDRQIVDVNLTPIGAGVTSVQYVVLPGAVSGEQSQATAVVASPPVAFLSAGLVLLNAYCSGTNAIGLAILNTTGATVDRPSEGWTFWVIR